jgi:hypothetical protein
VPQPKFRHLLLPLLLVTALAGCSKNGEQNTASPTNPGGGSNSAAMEEAEVAATMSESPDLVEDALVESDAEWSLDAGTSLAPSTSALIRPVTFWRKIERVERRFEIAFADTDSTGRPTTAHVRIHKHLFGTFNILAGRPEALAEGDPAPTPRDTSLRLVRKRLADHWVRRLLLKRVPPPSTDDAVASHRARWRIAATSGVQVTSKDATTDIISLRIQQGALDTTVTDALELFRLRRVIRLDSGEEVRLTMTTGRNDDIALLYLRGMRFRMRNNGDNTYSGAFRAAWLAGVHHFGVNALSRGTLFDDALPYDSQAWILPYVVAPTLLAEYRPEN